MDNLTIVIPFCDGHATIGALLDSVPLDIPVVIVDDLSDKPIHLERANTRIIRLAEKGYFAGACNTGIDACQTDVLILNQDAHFSSGAWQKFILDAQRAGHAIAGDGVMDHPAWPMGYVQGTFMFMSRAAIKKIGTLNQVDYPLWGGTCEWQLRACRAGFTANSVKTIPGFVHHRKGNFGSSIRRQLEREANKRDLFIRTPPAISVVIPCYNYGRFLTDAVHSLIGGQTDLGLMPGQTFQSFEIIIVDDLSTDNSREIAESLVNEWQAIRLIKRTVNGGTPAANNTGMAAARGKYVTHLSADDMREPWSLEAMYRAAEANPHSLVYDDICHFENGKRTNEWPMLEYNFERLVNKNYIHAGILFPRSAWQEVGGYPAIKHGREDWAMNVQLGIHGYCGVHVKRPGYLYRQHGKNRHFWNAGQGWRTNFVDQMKNLFPKIYEGERPMACCGGGAKNSPASLSAKSGPGLLPGKDGMTLLDYTGPSTAPQTWYGAVTGTTYLFGGKRVTGYVDNRDVQGFLEVRQGRRELFGRHVKAKPAAAQAPAEPLVLPQAEDPEIIPADDNAFDIEVQAVLDQNARTVIDFINDNIASLSAGQIAALLEAEKSGKARKGVLSHLEGLAVNA